MNTEKQIEVHTEAFERDRLETINQQLAETELALMRTLEFFDRVEGSELASRLGVTDLRLRLLADLQQLRRERDGVASNENDS